MFNQLLVWCTTCSSRCVALYYIFLLLSSRQVVNVNLVLRCVTTRVDGRPVPGGRPPRRRARATPHSPPYIILCASISIIDIILHKPFPLYHNLMFLLLYGSFFVCECVRRSRAPRVPRPAPVRGLMVAIDVLYRWCIYSYC